MIVDVHHHYLPRDYLDNIESYLPMELGARRQGEVISIFRHADGYVFPRINVRFWSDEAVQLSTMDAAMIQHAVVSAACFQDWMTLASARIINEGTAELVRRNPDRFSGMISVPPDGGQEMVREIYRAHKELGLCAINITTTHKDRYPDHEDFRLLFATASDLCIPVYVHPSWYGPQWTHSDKWNLERTIGKASDLNVCVARMLFSGAFTEYPNLRMLFSHLGGALPMTLRRLFYGQPGYLSTPDIDYATLLKRVFVDTAPGMWQSSAEIEYTTKKLGADQIMLGSDYPLSNDPADVLCQAVEHVRAAAIPLEAKEKIFLSNAMKFFGLKKIRLPLASAG